LWIPYVKKMKLLFLFPLLFFGNRVFAQYTVNGNATANNCHCYTLTPSTNFQSGSVWNNNKISLAQSFDFNFDIYLGCTDDNGADGIAFVLQPISTSVGSTGGGLGLSGISPSVGVTIDTWQNSDINDPVFDHIAIQVNGNLDHANTAANIAGPVTALLNSNNIEDCQWHTLRVKWDAAAKELTGYIDGNLRVTANKDLITDVFGNDPDVFWGFTGSTGGSANLQQFCTALTPRYNFLPGQKRCINEPITFYDSTISFTAVQKRYWDFGDGSDIDSVNINPVHIYTVAGDYTVTQTVVGADGCSEINTQTVRVSGKPVPAFTYNDSCEASQILFNDASMAPFGNINAWYWDFGNGATSDASAPETNYSTGGLKNIRHAVATEEGCLSDTAERLIYIYSRPQLDISFTDSVCLGTTMNFSGIVLNSIDPVLEWEWNFGGAPPLVLTQNASYTYLQVQRLRREAAGR
jgi:Bacterial lectin/PKD domain